MSTSTQQNFVLAEPLQTADLTTGVQAAGSGFQLAVSPSAQDRPGLTTAALRSWWGYALTPAVGRRAYRVHRHRTRRWWLCGAEDLHHCFSPDNPDWGHPPLEQDVPPQAGWGLVEDPGTLLGPAIVRWYRTVQWFNGTGFADLLR
jgi:hypothetical protein